MNKSISLRVERGAKNAMFEHLINAVKQAVYYASNQKNTNVGIYIVKSVYIIKKIVTSYY